jgi:electron transport complex protein RnfC
MTALARDRSFAHGIHPDEHKERTAGLRIERMPFTGRYTLPLGQHAGAPSRPVVRVGQRVRRGERIAEPDGWVSTALHSPVDGRVSALAKRKHPDGRYVDCVEVETDAFSSQEIEVRPAGDPGRMGLEAFIEQVRAAGLVGMGGAAFPTHVKYRLPEGKACERFVLNGCECEPYLTCDHRLMVERAGDVVRGVRMVAPKLGASLSTIGVERNKPDAIEALRAAVGEGEPIEVRGLETKYPQGAEKMLIRALYGVEVPAGRLPLDVGVVVNNVGTMVGIAEWFDRGQPLIERVVTVSGPGVERPANLMVPIGTPVREVLRHCGLSERACQVVMGGPMMGQTLAALDAPVLKGTGGLLAFTEGEVSHPSEYACVKCGRCLEACGEFLNPQRLARLARAGRYEDLERAYVMDCMECGACTFTCPSGVPIVHLIRVAKSAIRDRKARGA